MRRWLAAKVHRETNCHTPKIVRRTIDFAHRIVCEDGVSTGIIGTAQTRATRLNDIKICLGVVAADGPRIIDTVVCTKCDDAHLGDIQGPTQVCAQRVKLDAPLAAVVAGRQNVNRFVQSARRLINSRDRQCDFGAFREPLASTKRQGIRTKSNGNANIKRCVCTRHPEIEFLNLNADGA